MVKLMHNEMNEHSPPNVWSFTHAPAQKHHDRHDLGKPLHRKALRIFPMGITSTPTKTVDLYSNHRMNMQNPFIDIRRNGWKQ